MNEQNKKNEGGLFDKDPFPKDVWEIAYKNTGGKPFEKGNAFSATEENSKSPTSKLTPEQQRLKSELKAKKEARKTTNQTKSKPLQSHNTTIISGFADSKSPTVTPAENSTYRSSTSSENYSTKSKYESDEDEEESEDLEDIITKFLKKPFKEIEKAFAGEEYDKPTVAVAAVVIVLIIIVFGLLGS